MFNIGLSRLLIIHSNKCICFLSLHFSYILLLFLHFSILAFFNRAMDILSKLRHNSNLDILKITYYSLFHSHLLYACQFLGQKNQTSLNRVLSRILGYIVFRIFKKWHFFQSFTQICLKIILFLEKKAHFCQILQGAASNYQMLNSSELFPAKPSPNTSK